VSDMYFSLKALLFLKLTVDRKKSLNLLGFSSYY